MRKKLYLPFLAMACVVMIMSSCSSKLSPLTADYITTDSQPLEMVAGKVPVTIYATYPENWFNKKATVTVTPVLRYEGGEAWGNSYVYQGEKVSGNGQVINQKTGGNATMYANFDYVPEMLSSQLYLTFKAKVGNKEVTLPDVKIADGVLATADWVSAGSEKAVVAPDNFQRVIKEQYNADILFLIQQAEIRSAEIKKGSVTDWNQLVKDADAAENQNVDIEVSAYASPDGGLELNEKLAEKREKNTQSYLSKEMKKSKVDAPVNTRYTAQDWDGFKELVEKSNIQDKELILRVLSMYKDSEQREREIKNISSVFSVLADEILPQLRRSRLTANIEIIGKSDEELLQLSSSNPSSLNLEELLYAAHIADGTVQKKAIYTKASELFPKDGRAFNNLGVLAYNDGDYSSAINFFNKANQVAGSLPQANFNLGYSALELGDKAKAEQYFGQAAGIEEMSNAMGILAVMNGNYSQAAQAFKSNTNNAALAQIMNKDYNSAIAVLDKIEQPDATTSYLRAVVGARTNNLDAVVDNIKKAVSLNPDFATKALQDVEFSKFITNANFLNAILK